MPPPRHRPGVLLRVAMAPQSTQTSCEGVCERPAHNNNDAPAQGVAEAAHLHRASVSGEEGEVSGPVLFPASGTFALRALRCRSCLETPQRAGGNQASTLAVTALPLCLEQTQQVALMQRKDDEGPGRWEQSCRRPGRRDFHVRTMEKWPLRSMRTLEFTPDL